MTDTQSGGQAAVAALEAEETPYVFGLIGSATMELFDALFDSSIDLIAVHDERTGTHMADGFARASGRAGVVLAGQNGPGATNLVTGLAQAHAAYSPVISLAGMLSSGHVHRDAFQEVDQQALFTPVTKKTLTVPSPDRVQELIQEAHRVALAPRKGPVHVNMPRDVLSAQTPVVATRDPAHYRNHSLPAPDPAALARAAALLTASERPVIVAGGGIKDAGAWDHVRTLAETIDAPIVCSPGHGDAVPASVDQAMGQMGPRGNPVASQLVVDADVMLVLGSRLGFNSTFFSHDNINPATKIIQVEIEPTAIGRFFDVEVGIWADAVRTALDLVTACRDTRSEARRTWVRQAVDARDALRAERDRSAADTTPIQPSGLFKALRAAIPTDAAITMDAGTMCLQATDQLTYGGPRSLFTPLDFGLVGFSFACGLGVKLAMPDRPVVSLMGDGGFGMTMSELSTAVDHGISTVTVVMNNGSWGAEKAYQRDFFDGRFIGADVSSPPFDTVAEAYGATGFRATTVDEVADAVRAALDIGGPAVIDVAVDPNALYSFRRDSFTHRGG
ncbi:MAG: thiamine pyrophosphate-binding protein [Actinomycetota bacterium]